LKCIVVGGGISGMLTALHLRKEGMAVTLMEKNTLGRESSWAGGGILSPLYPWRYPDSVQLLASWSQLAYPQFLTNLQTETRIDPEYIRNGFLVLDTEEQDLAQAWADKYQILMQHVQGKVLSTIEPEIGKYATGLWFPDIGQVRNPRLMKALKRRLELAGVVIKENINVTKICTQQQQVSGVATVDGREEGDCVVVTTGAWSNELWAKFGIRLQIRPIRGQMILFAVQPGLVSRIILVNNHYVIPRRDGHLLVGSTVEDAGFEKITTSAALEDLKYLAFSVIPRLADYTVTQQWAGLRPGSPNGIPYITEHPEISGLFINAGHFRNGIVLGLASARLVTDLILQRPPIIDPSPYSLEAVRGDFG
jgi:glycine oxidase